MGEMMIQWSSLEAFCLETNGRSPQAQQRLCTTCYERRVQIDFVHADPSILFHTGAASQAY